MDNKEIILDNVTFLSREDLVNDLTRQGPIKVEGSRSISLKNKIFDKLRKKGDYYEPIDVTTNSREVNDMLIADKTAELTEEISRKK